MSEEEKSYWLVTMVWNPMMSIAPGGRSHLPARFSTYVIHTKSVASWFISEMTNLSEEAYPPNRSTYPTEKPFSHIIYSHPVSADDAKRLIDIGVTLFDDDNGIIARPKI